MADTIAVDIVVKRIELCTVSSSIHCQPYETCNMRCD